MWALIRARSADAEVKRTTSISPVDAECAGRPSGQLFRTGFKGLTSGIATQSTAGKCSRAQNTKWTFYKRYRVVTVLIKMIIYVNEIEGVKLDWLFRGVGGQVEIYCERNWTKNKV